MGILSRNTRIILLVLIGFLSAGFIRFKIGRSSSSFTRAVCLQCALQRETRTRIWRDFRRPDRVAFQTNAFAANHGGAVNCTHSWTNIYEGFHGPSAAGPGGVRGRFEIGFLQTDTNLQTELISFSERRNISPRTVWNRLAMHYCQYSRTNFSGIDDWPLDRFDSVQGAFSNWLSLNYTWISTTGIKPAR
jgi:hypothetical protein